MYGSDLLNQSRSLKHSCGGLWFSPYYYILFSCTVYLRLRAPKPILNDGPLFMISRCSNKPSLTAQSGDEIMCVCVCVCASMHHRQLDHSFYPRSILSLISDWCASPVTIKSPVVTGNCSVNTTYLLIILRLDDVLKTGLSHKVRGILFFYHTDKEII